MSQNQHGEQNQHSENATTDTSGAPASSAGKTGGCPFPHGGVSRRSMFTRAGVSAAAAGLAGLAGGYALHEQQNQSGEPISMVYDFRGTCQAGITTPAQDNMFTAVFDIDTDDVEQFKSLLTEWTVAAEQMAAGELVGGEPNANKELPPRDTGEAWGYQPNGLTITFGLGKGVFVDADGNDRFGLAEKMPAVLDEGMPAFPHESLREQETGGDLLIQACANDAQVCLHAIRNLTRIAFGTATMRWSQLGYGRTSSTSTEQETARNLFGFKDGTNNVKAEEPAAELDAHLWVQSGDDAQADWMAGGTYFVARKIRMFAEVWDRISLGEQEAVMGRDKRFGAPLSIAHPSTAQDEFTAADYEVTDDDGELMIPMDAHIAIVAPENNEGRRMLRRGYNYTDGVDSLGRIRTGLFFVAFVRDPRTNFYPILQRMTQEDALDEYLQHQGSALFAIPAGVGTSDTTIAQALFG